MADLEQRVTTLEREVSVLKERVGADEEDVRNIPDLIKMEFRLANSQMARLSRRGLLRDLTGRWRLDAKLATAGKSSDAQLPSEWWPNSCRRCLRRDRQAKAVITGRITHAASWPQSTRQLSP